MKISSIEGVLGDSIVHNNFKKTAVFYSYEHDGDRIWPVVNKIKVEIETTYNTSGRMESVYFYHISNLANGVLCR